MWYYFAMDCYFPHILNVVFLPYSVDREKRLDCIPPMIHQPIHVFGTISMPMGPKRVDLFSVPF